MVGNPKFSSVNYVDLFAGSGLCLIESNGATTVYPGSTTLAACCDKPFDNLFAVERDAERLAALERQVASASETPRLRSWNGDANALIDEVAASIPKASLNLAFVDPFSLDIHYRTIETLARRRSVDLIILFADDSDLLRNVEAYYYPKPQSKLDAFLGSRSNWRERWDKMENRSAEQVRVLFADTYLDQLRQIGYHHSATQPILMNNRPLYRLIYASKHKLGLKFWNIAVREHLDGQRGLFPI